MNHRQTIMPLAEQVLAQAHTPEQLEEAIKAQGDLVEFHHLCGRNEPARIAFQTVRQLVALRTPDTIRAMEEARGLRHGT